mgnify:CR=1 FL=1
MSKDVFVPAFVSLIINAFAVPWFVRVNDESVVVSARVNAMFRASVVVMVLPPLYADCRVIDAAEHFTTLFEPSIHNVFPVAVVKPFTLRNESESVLNVMLFALLGEKVAEPDAFNEWS